VNKIGAAFTGSEDAVKKYLKEAAKLPQAAQDEIASIDGLIKKLKEEKTAREGKLGEVNAEIAKHQQLLDMRKKLADAAVEQEKVEGGMTATMKEALKVIEEYLPQFETKSRYVDIANETLKQQLETQTGLTAEERKHIEAIVEGVEKYESLKKPSERGQIQNLIDTALRTAEVTKATGDSVIEISKSSGATADAAKAVGDANQTLGDHAIQWDKVGGAVRVGVIEISKGEEPATRLATKLGDVSNAIGDIDKLKGKAEGTVSTLGKVMRTTADEDLEQFRSKFAAINTEMITFLEKASETVKALNEIKVAAKEAAGDEFGEGAVAEALDEPTEEGDSMTDTRLRSFS
jgi:hypothetical protein